MKKILLILLAFGFFSVVCFAQKKGRTATAPAPPVAAPLSIPLTPERWVFQPGKVEFLEHRGIRAMKLLPNAGPVVAKDLTFANGTIEYDVEPLAPPSWSVYFRRKDDKTQEIFYLRNRLGQPQANDAVQYAPIVDGVNLWDLFDPFQAPARLKAGDWNHVKLVISGYQMRVYVNDLTQPVLEIPRLEADATEGGLAFDGQCILANVVVKPGEIEGLAPYAAPDLTNHDARYLRNWLVSEPVALPTGSELTGANVSKPDQPFQKIEAERRGLINLSRKFGNSQNQRRVVWLKTNFRSASNQKPLLRLGFSDEVWVFVNGQPVFVDKNLYPQNMRKTPDGRISIENAAFPLPLKTGDNELLVGVANNFYGWGLVARLESLEGIEQP